MQRELYICLSVFNVSYSIYKTSSAMLRLPPSTLFCLEFSIWCLNSVYLASVSENIVGAPRRETAGWNWKSKARGNLFRARALPPPLPKAAFKCPKDSIFSGRKHMRDMNAECQRAYQNLAIARLNFLIGFSDKKKRESRHHNWENRQNLKIPLEKLWRGYNVYNEIKISSNCLF